MVFFKQKKKRKERKTSKLCVEIWFEGKIQFLRSTKVKVCNIASPNCFPSNNVGKNSTFQVNFNKKNPFGQADFFLWGLDVEV